MKRRLSENVVEVLKGAKLGSKKACGQPEALSVDGELVV